MIGIVGFRPAYGGHGYLAAGAAGVILGLLLSHAGQRARLPLPAVAAVSVLAFLLFGGIVSQAGTVSRPALRPWSTWRSPVGATADHRPAGRPHRRAAGPALPARPVQRGGRARAGAADRARGTARRRARRRGGAVHLVRRGPADRRRPAGRRVRGLRPRLGRRCASSAARPCAPRSAGSGPGSGSARRPPCSPSPGRAPPSSVRTCRARAPASASCSTSSRPST